MSDDCHSTAERRAAKEHRCDECHGFIAKGETHTVMSGICDGAPYRVRMCPICAKDFERANALAWKENGEGLPFGTLREDVFESFDAERMATYIANMIQRHSEVLPWMWSRFMQVAFVPA